MVTPFICVITGVVGASLQAHGQLIFKDYEENTTPLGHVVTALGTLMVMTAGAISWVM